MAISSYTDRIKPVYSGNESGGYSVTRELLIETTTDEDGPVEIANSLPIRAGDSYQYESESSAFLVADAIGPIKAFDKKKRLWTCPVTYSTEGAPDFRKQDNPIDWATEWSGSTQQVTRVVTEDEDGKPIVNAAGDPVTETIEVPHWIATLRAVKNVPVVRVSWMERYGGAWNSATFKGRPKLTVQCTHMGFSTVRHHKGRPYYQAQFEFQIHTEKHSHQVEIPNIGLYALDPVTAEKFRIAEKDLPQNAGKDLDDPNAYVMERQPLDKDGWIADQNTPEEDKVIKPKLKFKKANFNELGL